MATHFLPDEMGDTSRPGLIGGLGIASFLNTGFFMLVYALGILVMTGLQQMPLEEVNDLVREQMAQFSAGMSEDDQAKAMSLVGVLHANGALLMLLLLVRTVLRFAGVVGIWKGRRSGFYTYASAQIAGIFLPHVVLPWEYLGVFGPLMSLLVTALYGSQLKRLG
ncbi:MAG: hypothetical protein JNM31_00235 [Flavobacteriales bacterium]|nr:hypothetical protein [Flavobacteriales bacterium]